MFVQRNPNHLKKLKQLHDLCIDKGFDPNLIDHFCYWSSMPQDHERFGQFNGPYIKQLTDIDFFYNKEKVEVKDPNDDKKKITKIQSRGLKKLSANPTFIIWDWLPYLEFATKKGISLKKIFADD